MDRRNFLAAGGLAMTTPLLPATATAAHATAPGKPLHDTSRRVDLVSDGLGLDPHEYATQLQQVVDAGAIDADNYSRGGAIGRLEALFAKLLGKPAAMYVPTGTLANHLAVRRLAGDDRRVLVQAESHLYNDSGDGAQSLSGLNLVPLAPGQATLRLADVQPWVERSRGGRVRNEVGVIAIETPVRRRDHAMADFGELERISAYAREQGIRLHLDGARLFTLPLHSGRPVTAYAALFDSVYVSLWKNFNGAGGAILAGSEAFIDGLFHQRRMFGGAPPSAWPQVALVEAYANRFEDDYARAWRAADELVGHLEASGRFRARRLPDGSSRFFLSVAGVAPELVAERARGRGIVLAWPHPDTGEFPVQVNPTLLRLPPAELARRLLDSLDG